MARLGAGRSSSCVLVQIQVEAYMFTLLCISIVVQVVQLLISGYSPINACSRESGANTTCGEAVLLKLLDIPWLDARRAE